MRLLANYPNCSICGHHNDNSLKATFYRDNDKVVAYSDFTESQAGYKGIVHGGIISAVLDEALGRIVTSITGKMVMTGELNVRFLRPIATGAHVVTEATMDEEQKHARRFWWASGKMYDPQSGQVYAKARGRFFPIAEEKYQPILTTLELHGQNRAVTMEDL